MKLYYTNGNEFFDDYTEYLKSLGDELTDLFCATHNVYSGIGNWPNYESESSLPPWRKMGGVQRYLTICDKVNGSIIFNKENKNESIQTNKRKWPNIKWCLHPENHTKIYVSCTKGGQYVVWTGSANLSNSKWHDSVHEIKDDWLKKEMIRQYRLILSESIKVI